MTKEERHEYNVIWYQRNKKSVDARNKRWYLKHKAKVLAYSKKYYDTYRSSFNSWKRKNEKRRMIEVEINAEEYRSLVSGSCTYCGLDRFIGIDRVDSNIGYTKDNSVSCCKYCNYGKYTLSPEEFIEHCRRVVEFNNPKEEI